MTQAPQVGRTKSVRVEKENPKYERSAIQPAPRRSVRTMASPNGPNRHERAADCGAVELAELRRWKARGEELLMQTGCSSLTEVGQELGALRRAAATTASSNGASSSCAVVGSATSRRRRPGPVWARMQNCRGPDKQKTDDIYIQCMGPKQKTADLRNPPGLSTIVMTRTDPKDARPIARPRVVRLFGQPTSRHGADPAHGAELLFQAEVKTAANKEEIAEKLLQAGGLSAFMLPDGTLNLRLRRAQSADGQIDGWLGPPQNDKGDKAMPSRWVPTKWQQNRWKEGDKTADDNVRPFSVEIELKTGEKIMCETPFRIQSTGDAVMDGQHMNKKRKGSQRLPQPRKQRARLKPAVPSAVPLAVAPTGPSLEMTSDEDIFSSSDGDQSNSPRSSLDALAEANAAGLTFTGYGTAATVDLEPGAAPLLEHWPCTSSESSLGSSWT